MTTQVIIETVNDTIVVETSGITTVITAAEQGPTGPTGPAGPTGPTGPTGLAGIQNIADAADVDTTGKLEGSILIYSIADQKWKATRLLEQQAIESEQY